MSDESDKKVIEDISEAGEADQVLRAKINLETSQINWHDLQPFFARGQVVVVSSSLDLVEVAYQLTLDNKTQFEEWQAQGAVTGVDDAQALEWFENKKDLWAVVVRPWILVQDK